MTASNCRRTVRVPVTGRRGKIDSRRRTDAALPRLDRAR